jgi:hypothetical protein
VQIALPDSYNKERYVMILRFGVLLLAVLLSVALGLMDYFLIHGAMEVHWGLGQMSLFWAFSAVFNLIVGTVVAFLLAFVAIGVFGWGILVFFERGRGDVI